MHNIEQPWLNVYENSRQHPSATSISLEPVRIRVIYPIRVNYPIVFFFNMK